eukprot:CAMPEP_0114568284 /NCGR_PEP_ID=MMETSP0114-20121206/15970_1 /TAXON_ID=31324 /ORGANISM="Goniomonas sp, Strain m" /LENGTH=81 /DNA_ID=CAMNT_0001755005 /DNA_START=213 /DNA_END=458 /DNA_ORIENTATION=-
MSQASWLALFIIPTFGRAFDELAVLLKTLGDRGPHMRANMALSIAPTATYVLKVTLPGARTPTPLRFRGGGGAGGGGDRRV